MTQGGDERHNLGDSIDLANFIGRRLTRSTPFSRPWSRSCCGRRQTLKAPRRKALLRKSSRTVSREIILRASIAQALLHGETQRTILNQALKMTEDD